MALLQHLEGADQVGGLLHRTVELAAQVCEDAVELLGLLPAEGALPLALNVVLRSQFDTHLATLEHFVFQLRKLALLELKGLSCRLAQSVQFGDLFPLYVDHLL